MIEQIPALMAWLKSAGLVGILGSILYAQYRGVWYWGKDYKRLEQENKALWDLALSGTGLAEGLLRIRRSPTQT